MEPLAQARGVSDRSFLDAQQLQQTHTSRVAQQPSLVGATSSNADRIDQHIDAENISLDLSLDRTTIRAADTVTLTLRIITIFGVQLDLPAFKPQDKLGEFTIVSIHDEPATTSTDGTRIIRTRRYTLEPFLPGDYTIPALDIAWQQSTSDSTTPAQGQISTEPITITVVSLLPEPAKATPAPNVQPALDPGTIRGEYTAPPIAESHVWWRWAALAIIVLGFSVAALGTWAVRRKKDTHDPIVSAIERLGSLRAGELPPSQTVVVCDELSAAVREAVVDRLGPSARSRTSAEILDEIRRNSLAHLAGPDIVTKGGQLLERLDAVRFSGQELSSAEQLGLIDATLDVLGHAKEARGERA